MYSSSPCRPWHAPKHSTTAQYSFSHNSMRYVNELFTCSSAYGVAPTRGKTHIYHIIHTCKKHVKSNNKNHTKTKIHRQRAERRKVDGPQSIARSEGRKNTKLTHEASNTSRRPANTIPPTGSFRSIYSSSTSCKRRMLGCSVSCSMLLISLKMLARARRNLSYFAGAVGMVNQSPPTNTLLIHIHTKKNAGYLRYE